MLAKLRNYCESYPNLPHLLYIIRQKKLLKEKLLGKLQTGNITTFLGIGFLICAIYVDFLGGMNSNDLRMLYLAGAILLGVGIAFLINYSKGKKMLAKEMEAEEKKLIAEANS